MSRFGVVLYILTVATTLPAQTQPTSDPTAISLAQKSVMELTGGNAISDITLKGSVISVLGSDYETGTGTFMAKGTADSRVDLTLSGGRRSDVRNATTGLPGGAWKKNGGRVTAYAQHNCWADAVWFFPTLSSLSQTYNPNYIFKYIGQEQHGGVATQHIRIYQVLPKDLDKVFQRPSTTDVYLDPSSSIPLAIATTLHPDNSMAADISTEVRFANYQITNGVRVPFRFERMLNGTVVLDATVTSVGLNTGLSDNLFNLQ